LKIEQFYLYIILFYLDEQFLYQIFQLQNISHVKNPGMK